MTSGSRNADHTTALRLGGNCDRNGARNCDRICARFFATEILSTLSSGTVFFFSVAKFLAHYFWHFGGRFGFIFWSKFWPPLWAGWAATENATEIFCRQLFCVSGRFLSPPVFFLSPFLSPLVAFLSQYLPCGWQYNRAAHVIDSQVVVARFARLLRLSISLWMAGRR